MRLRRGEYASGPAAREPVGPVRRRDRRRWIGATALVACLVALSAGAVPARASVGYTGYIASNTAGTLTPFDTATGALGPSTAVGSPAAIAITPDGSTAWVVDYAQGAVTPVDLATGAPGSPVTVGAKPDAIAITPDGAAAYVVNWGSGSVSVIDLATRTVAATITVGSAPDAVVITPDGTKAYVANSGAETVTPIATSTGTAGAPIAVGTEPDTLAVTPDGSTVWVGNLGSDSITPIDTATDTAGPSVAVSDPSAIAITPDGTKAYVANWTEGTLTPVTLPSGAVGTPIAGGAGHSGPPFVGGVNPYQVAISPDGTTAYYGDDNSNTVTPVTVATDSAQPNISLPSGPEGIAIVPDQAPVASFTVTRAAEGAPTVFDASASTVSYGAIASYAWDFGDGHSATTSAPTTSHTYSTPGTYTTTLTETDTAGTSTTQVFTGTTMSRDGAATARATRTVSVPPLPPWIATRTVSINAHGEVPIRLRCPARASGGCRGTITIELAGRGSRRVLAVLARCARGCRQLGRRRFAIRAGATAVVDVRISAYGRRLLAARRALRARVTVTENAAGLPATATRTITLTARGAHGPPRVVRAHLDADQVCATEVSRRAAPRPQPPRVCPAY